MSVQIWQGMSILDGALELAGHGRNVVLETSCNQVDTTPLSTTSGWTTCIGGLKSATVSLDLMANFAVADAIDSTLYSYLGVADVPKSVVTNSADGSFAYLMRGITLGYSPVEGQVGDLAMTKVSGQSSTGALVRGQLIHPGSASRTSSSTGTGRQMGAVTSTQSLYAALHVLSISGTSTPTLTVKIQSDDNAGFTSATDRITFTANTAVGYEWKSVAGAITDDYWRVSYTISGTNPVFSFAVVAGIL